MAPSRPAVYVDQIGLLVFCALAIGGGIYVVVRVLAG